jgi:hypothetical protein
MPKNRNNAGNSNRRPQAPKARRDSQARSSGRSRRGRERHISVRGELREQPDMRRLARAVIQIAMAQAEAAAQAEREASTGREVPVTDSDQATEVSDA